MINKNEMISKDVLKNISYYRVATELHDEYKSKITPTEYSLLDSIWRILVGWGKSEDFITNSLLAQKTGLNKNTITTTLKKLQSYKMIFIEKIIKNGFEHQFIKINFNFSEYIFSKKEKIVTKVKNFFCENTNKKDVEIIKTEPIIINSPSQQIGQLEINKTDFTIPTDRTVTIPTLGNNINSININNKNIDNINKKNDNDVLENDKDYLEVKNALVANNFYNSDSFIKQHGIKKIKNALDYITLAIEEGLSISSVGAYLRKNIDLISKKEVQVIEEKIISSGPAKNYEEEKIKKFFFEKGKLFNTNYSEALNICLEKLFLNKDVFSFMSEFKSLVIKKEALKNMYLKVCKDDILFSNKYPEKFLNEVFFNLDNLETVKEKEMVLVENRKAAQEKMKKEIEEKNKRLMELKKLAEKEVNNESYSFINRTINASKNIINDAVNTIKETTKRVDIFGFDLDEAIPV